MHDQDIEACRAAIAALESQRATLGDAVLALALAPLRARLAGLQPPPAEPGRRLRQVSVLFLDIVGSTQLIQHLEPEDVQSVVDGALAAFAQVVVQHGGEVLRYAGDNLKAAFGANGTREDDAERAVNCGLALLQEALRHGDAVRQAHGHQGFDARVGIHTGPVVRGGGVEADNSLSGLAVNIAARLEQAAPPGTLRISQDTWAMVRGSFDAEAQAPVAVKGLDAPVSSWLVRGAKPRDLRLPARGIEGLETPLIGRQSEIERFEAALAGLLADRAPRTLTLIADAGLGKSRLLHEFQHTMSARHPHWWLMAARAQPSGTLQPYGLLRDLLARRFEIADSDRADVARDKLVRGLAPWLREANDPAPELLGHLIGLDFSAAPAVQRMGSDTALLRDRALAAFGLWLARLGAADGAPVVLLLDDLHWSDDASLDALATLLERASGPMLALLCARPGLIERRPDWGAGLRGHERIPLAPLDAAHSAELTGSLLRRLGTAPAALTELIVRQAEGNPFYAEELVKMLLDKGVIESRDGDWVCHEQGLLPGRLPATLVGVLQARIDALDPAARQALQMASVIGAVFWDDALAALDPRGPAALPTLQRKVLVQRRPTSAFEDTAEESFHHHLLHQVSYDTVLRPQRHAAHARAAAWLTERVGARSDEYLAITAEHHERAGQPALAANWFERASIKAGERHASRAALHYLDRAESQAALAPEPWPLERQADALQRRVVLCDALTLREPQAQALDRLLALGEAQGQPVWVGRALTNQALLAFNLGQVGEAEALARRGAAVCEGADDATHAARCRCNLAILAMKRRDLDAARQDLVHAARWAALARERRATPDAAATEVQVWLVQAQLHGHERDEAARRAVLARALAAVAPLNAPRQACMCHNAVALAALVCADFDEVAFHLDAVTRLAAEFGLPLQTAIAQLQRAQMHVLARQWDDGVREAMAAAEKFRATGGALNELISRLYAAEAHWWAGRVDEAVSIWQQVAPALQQRGDGVGARTARLRVAEAQAATGRPEAMAAALRCVHAELPALQARGALASAHFGMVGRFAAWRVLRRAGDPAAAGQLALAADEIEEHLSTFADPQVRARVVQTSPWLPEVLDAVARAKAA